MSARLVPRSDDVALLYPSVHLLAVDVPNRPSTLARRDVKERLGLLAGRIDGPWVLRQHEREVPKAYRVLYQQMGIDPDVQPTPIDALLRERIAYGHFRSLGVVRDALRIALLETGVPVWAMDAAKVSGELVVRMVAPVDAGPDGASAAVPVVADDRGPITSIGTAPGAPFEVTRTTTDLCVYALQCGGVSTMHVQEALWLAESLLHHR